MGGDEDDGTADMSDEGIDRRLGDGRPPSWGEPVPPVASTLDEPTAAVPASGGLVDEPATRNNTASNTAIAAPIRPRPAARRDPQQAGERRPTGRSSATGPRRQAEPIRVGRRERRKVHIVERFTGRRVRAKTGVWRRIRSVVFIIVIGAVLAAIVAAILAAIVAGIALGIHHVGKG